MKFTTLAFATLLAPFAALGVPAFAGSFTCDASLVGTVLHGSGPNGTISGKVTYSQNPFSLQFEAQDGGKTNLFGETSFCGFSVKAGQCHGPLPANVTAEYAALDCDGSGKEFRTTGPAPGSNVTDGNFWFDTDHGMLECWSFMSAPTDRPLKTLVHFENCR
jgi:hypothetical protein